MARAAREIDLRVGGNAPDLPCFQALRALPKERAPLIVGFFGPNASGKSTVLRALTTIKWFLQSSFSLPPNSAIPLFNPYFLKDWVSRPTKITIDYESLLS